MAIYRHETSNNKKADDKSDHAGDVDQTNKTQTASDNHSLLHLFMLLTEFLLDKPRDVIHQKELRCQSREYIHMGLSPQKWEPCVRGVIQYQIYLIWSSLH